MNDALEPWLRASSRLRKGRLLLVFLWFVAQVSLVQAASFTAALDRNAIAVGEVANLSLTFEGGTPRALPAFQVPGNLVVQSAGQSQQYSIINGRATSSISYNYQVSSSQPG